MYILPVRKGGLGNQMFQVAAAIIYGREIGYDVIIPSEQHHIHNKFNNNYNDSVFKYIGSYLNNDNRHDIIQTLLNTGDFVLYPKEVGFESWDCIPFLGKNIILHGYFQYYPQIQKHEIYIRNIYLNGLKDILKESVPDTQCIGIHVRRGDYLKYPHSEAHYTQDEFYYKKSIDIFIKNENSERNQNLKFKIFSDDIEWCKKQTIFKENLNFEFIEEQDEILSLKMMINCHGGFICANSTFSWWGAFLGAYSVKKTCIVPSKWIKNEIVDKLFPDEWIII